MPPPSPEVILLSIRLDVINGLEAVIFMPPP